MCVEDSFAIEMGNSETEKIVTPGQLIELVMSKVALATSASCLTQRSFHFVRRFLIGNFGLKRSQIFPEAKLAPLIPRKSRAQFLRQLCLEAGTQSPPILVREPGLNLLAAGAWIAACFTLWHGATGATTSLSRLLFLILSLVLAGLFAFIVNGNFLTEFPPSIPSVGELSRWIRAHTSTLGGVPANVWTRDEVARRVREIVIEFLDCEKNYREDARFVQDLGMS